jgi:RNA polymerase subunit RPABC4/transcription elongation factor Spt4
VKRTKLSLDWLTNFSNSQPEKETSWKFCRSCGSVIPYNSTYCPNCGTIQETLSGLSPAIPVGREKESLARRIGKLQYTIFFMSLAIFIVAFLLGSMAFISQQEAQAIIDAFNTQIGSDPTAYQIFENNITLCLLFFIPFFGTAFMAFVGYNTGMVLAALALLNPQLGSPVALALTLFLFPWTWMEFVAYSLASSTGLMVIISIIGRRLRVEARKFLIILVIAIFLLIIGAIIEELAISSAMAN